MKQVLSIFIFAFAITCLGGESDLKGKLMPKVGKEFVATGVLRSAKLGWWIGFEDSGVYVKTKDSKSTATTAALSRYENRKVTISGTLHYQPGIHHTNPMVAGIPEHFFFEAGQCRVIEVK